jgi:starvation-inducible DNA-binding protein
MTDHHDVLPRRQLAPLVTPSDMGELRVREVSAALNGLLADVFALYLKTKNFHWHVGGPHFRDHHLLMDEQADQIFAMTDPLAERVRKLGGQTLRSIGHIARLQRLSDNDDDTVAAFGMLVELRQDNQVLVDALRVAHTLCEDHGDVASASLLETWIDESERRVWFLLAASSKDG